MAYSQTLELVTGDTLPMLTITLRDSNAAAGGATLDGNDQSTWAPIDITGATVIFRIREVGASVVVGELEGVVVDGAAGKVAISFEADTFETAGQYEGELEVTFDGSGTQTVVELIKFKVRASFD